MMDLNFERRMRVCLKGIKDLSTRFLCLSSETFGQLLPHKLDDED